MKKYNKWIAFLLALVLMIGVMAAAPVSVSAEDDGEFSYITLYAPDKNGNIAIRPSTGEPSEVYDILTGACPQGVSYDAATHTLTLDHYKRPDLMLAIRSEKGLPYTVSIKGKCALAGLGFLSGGAPDYLITGDGSLTVNAEKRFPQAIRMYSPDYLPGARKASLRFGKDVRLRLFGSACILTALTTEAESPFAALNGTAFTCETKQNTYEHDLSVSGFTPDPYPNLLGYRLQKAEDPAGIYAVNDEYDEATDKWMLCIKKYIYFAEADIYLPDASFTPVVLTDDTLPDGYSYTENVYGAKEELKTIPYYEATYCLVRTAEGKEYLAREWSVNDLDECISITCDAWTFATPDGLAVNSKGEPYAFLNEKQRVTFVGGQDTAHQPAAVLGNYCVIERGDYYRDLGYRVNPVADPDGIYTFYQYDAGSENNNEYYCVFRWIYDAESNHYYEDRSFDSGELSPEAFRRDYVPVKDAEDELVMLRNPENFRQIYDAYLYTDGSRQYACETRWDNEANENRIKMIYTYTPLSGIKDEDGSQLYYLLPAEVQDVSRLNRVTETIATGSYEHTVPGTDLYYNTAPGILDPPEITSAAVTYTGVKVTWKADEEAVNFRVFRREAGKSWNVLADTKELTYTDKTAVSGKIYAYTVRCLSADGKSFLSSYHKTGKAVLYVAAPKISKLQNVNGGVKLTVNAVKGAGYYRFFVKSGGKWKTLGDTKATSFVAKNLKSGGKYTFTVRALNAKKKAVSAYSTNGWTNVYIAQPALPTLKNTKNGVQITYKKSAGAAKYRILRKTGSGKWIKLVDTTALKYTDKTAKKGMKYSYTVACITKNGKSYTSSYHTTGRTIICKR